jgi:Fuc2NAc and GlcNAc transferase
MSGTAATLIMLTAILSFLLTGLATQYSRRRGLIDLPGDRTSHAIATPRGGGAGLIAALLIATAIKYLISDHLDFWIFCTLPGALALSWVGWWDDHRSLSVKFRFAVQLVVSIYLIWCATDVALLGGGLWMLAAVVFLLWTTNLYNFMDGSNGMAGLQGVFVAVVLAGLFHAADNSQAVLICLMVGAACLGFLPWNLGRARVFMGDVASGSLGFIFAALLIYGVTSQAFGFSVALLVMLVFVTDSSLTLLMRVINGERWYTAHKQHLYQRLIAHGWSHGSVLLFYQALNLVLVTPAIVIAIINPATAWIVVLAVAMLFGIGWYLLIRRFGVLV